MLQHQGLQALSCHVLKTDIREKNGGLPILHASISAKWTMRSDRAQNSRTEALNLIRNRKGHLPHIAVLLVYLIPHLTMVLDILQYLEQPYNHSPY